MNNVVQFQEHRYCTEKFVLHVHVCLCMAKYCTSDELCVCAWPNIAQVYMCVCAWPNIVQVYSVPYCTSRASHVTGNLSLMLLLAQMPSTSDMFLVLKLPPCINIAMPCPLFSSVYTCSYMHGILYPS